MAGGENGWCEIKHATTTSMIKEYQMWKMDGNSLVSQFRDATLAIHGDNVLSAYIGDGDVTGAVSIDGSTTSSFKFPLTGWHCKRFWSHYFPLPIQNFSFTSLLLTT